jgi:hypothetical protein
LIHPRAAKLTLLLPMLVLLAGCSLGPAPAVTPLATATALPPTSAPTAIPPAASALSGETATATAGEPNPLPPEGTPTGIPSAPPAGEAAVVPTGTLVPPTLVGIGPTPTYAPEPQWPTDAPPTPFPPPQTIPAAADLSLPAAPALSAFATGLRPAAAGDLAGQERRSLYQIAMRLDPANQQVLGRERVTITNRQAVPLSQVVLRLYPNFPGTFDERITPTGFGRLQVGGARVGDMPVDAGYLAGNTAVAIPLPQALPPGGRQTVELEFRLRTDGLGPAPDIWYFKSFYPLLAVYDAGGWRLDVTDFPDQTYAESSFYTVDWTVPHNIVLASSGSETGQTPAGDAVTHHILAGPVREFAATASTRYRQETRAVDGITIRATALLTDTQQAGIDLGIAGQSLQVYDTLFGQYPFNDFDLVLTPDTGGGIEFPGYVMISHARPTNHVREHIVSHEVAHQWWYSLVGDDIYREAWLDESFADYSTYLYLQKTAGAAVADQVFRQQIAGVWPGYSGNVKTADPFTGKRVGSAVWEFRDFQEYDGIIYGKGPVFLQRLRLLLGDDRFFRLLQQHYQRNKYNITTGRLFLSEAVAIAGPDAPAVEKLYRQWIDGQRR